MDDIKINSDETLTEVNDNLSLIQKKDGFTFGTDALLLAAFIRKHKCAIAADLGSGTGIISMLCARRNKFAKIYAIELQPEYAGIIARNIAHNGLADIIEPVCADIRSFSLNADVVFSNPPYMKDKSGIPSSDSGRNAARREINGGIDDFCAAAERILKFGGIFYIVYRPDRMVDLLCALRCHNLEPKRMALIYADYYHEPCLVLTEAKKGASPSLIIPKPLFLSVDGKMSAEAKYIYDTGEWFS